jgi:HK97 family phage portal protein
LWGKAYVEKKMSGNTITSLVFLMPNLVTRRLLSNGEYEYRYTDPKTRKTRIIAASNMWHTPAFTVDGINGLTPVQVGANVFGGAMAADEASADTFKNSLRSPGLVLMDATLQKEQREAVREHVKKVSAAGGVMVLEKGAGFQQLSMNPEDAELLASRSFNVEEICRWFRVDPSLVGHKQGTTQWGTGIEQMMIAFLTFTLRPWAVRIEQSIRKDLFSPAEKHSLSAEFAIEGLLRGDSAARSAFYSSMTQNGIYTRDDCRRKENLPAMGGNAAVLTVQSALLPIDMLGQNVKDQAAAEALRNFLNSNSSEGE